MIVHYVPCYVRPHAAAVWSQPAPDCIRCEWLGNVYEVDFTDDAMEYEIPEGPDDVIHAAWRENGVLHVQVGARGDLAEPTTIDHGTEEQLGW